MISERRACRLCWESARTRQQPGRAVDLADAVPFGQQLFLANTQSLRQPPHQRRRHTPATIERDGGPLPRLSSIGHDRTFTLLDAAQLVLFDSDPDAAVVVARARRADSALMAFCDQVVRDHALVHGWSRKQTNDVRRSLRLVEALRTPPAVGSTPVTS